MGAVDMLTSSSASSLSGNTNTTKSVPLAVDPGGDGRGDAAGVTATALSLIADLDVDELSRLVDGITQQYPQQRVCCGARDCCPSVCRVCFTTQQCRFVKQEFAPSYGECVGERLLRTGGLEEAVLYRAHGNAHGLVVLKKLYCTAHLATPMWPCGDSRMVNVLIALPANALSWYIDWLWPSCPRGHVLRKNTRLSFHSRRAYRRRPRSCSTTLRRRSRRTTSRSTGLWAKTLSLLLLTPPGPAPASRLGLGLGSRGSLLWQLHRWHGCRRRRWCRCGETSLCRT